MAHTRTLLALFLLVLPLTGLVTAAEDGTISSELINRFEQDLAKQGNLDLMVNAVTNNDIKSLSLNRDLIMKYNGEFNMTLKGTKIINQKSSGRCWMYAGSNVITPRVMTKLQLSDFKLSKAYLAFWDKLEKSNHFLEKMIEYRDRPPDDRSLLGWLESPVGDGGWWTYFQGLIDKYGIVPASAMPETYQSSKTARLNALLNKLLKKATAEVRRLSSEGKSVEELRQYKESVLSDVYKLLVCNYGNPPKEFVFRWEDKGEGEDSTKSLTEATYTPRDFYNEFYGNLMPEYVAVTHNPAKETGKTYLFKDGRNMMEIDDVLVLNLTIDDLKHYTMTMLKDSQLVWFACDVGPDNFNDSGIFAVDIYDYNRTFGIDFSMTKTDRVLYEATSPNHAMVILGADTTANGVPRKWQVENSWGTDKGNSGYWTMYDDWYDENVLLVIVDKSLLSDEHRRMFEQKPIIIEDWEPFFGGFRNIQ